MLTKQKDDLAVSNALHYFMTNEYEVCLPIGDKQAYDMIVEKSGMLSRIQVKYAEYHVAIGQHKVALRKQVAIDLGTP